MFFHDLIVFIDIILTTLKPRLKNVTSEDVASSLYYLHLDVPSDTSFLDAQEEAPDTTTLPAHDTVILRKPVRQDYPGRKPVGSEPLPPLPPRPGLDQRQVLTETPFANRSQANTTSESVNMSRTSIDRKPLPNIPIAEQEVAKRPQGPRPNLGASQPNRQGVAREESKHLNSNISLSNLDGLTSRPPLYKMSSGTSPKIDNVPLIETFSITVIRRDPVSGEQWNVGKIRGHQPREESYPASGERSKRDKPSPTYSVHLDTLGYGQFRGSQATSEDADDYPNSGIFESSSFINTGFNRVVHMEGSNFWERSFKSHQRGSSDLSESRLMARSRSNSDLLKSTIPGTGDEESAPLNPSKPKGRGYVFSSPWNGRCEFSTGSTGRSLKCKHRLKEPPSAARPISYSRESELISELRFNLPPVAIFSSQSTSPNKSQPSESIRASKFQHIRNKLSASRHLDTEPKVAGTSYAAMYPHDDEDLGVYDRLDLSLGQEKAGGGVRGTRAKLGKLIVLDEGLKMLDLIVAANMGIWWGIWEK